MTVPHKKKKTVKFEFDQNYTESNIKEELKLDDSVENTDDEQDDKIQQLIQKNFIVKNV